MLLVLTSLLVSLTAAPTTKPAIDPRNLLSGSTIPDEGYCDQPYVVVRKDGAWLCTLTTGKGKEGDKGQHVVATISKDQGHTWSPLIDIEPADGPEASWVTPLIIPSGRIYAFYDYNGDGVTSLDGKQIRADMLGWYVYKYSDDGGLTWSQRSRLPVRVTACDRGNQWGGKVQVLWGIDKPIAFGNSVMFGFTKLGRYMLEEGEGWFFRSENILTEPDASKIEWQMLPDGDHGVRAPEFGSIQEEHNLVPLSDKSLYCIYRTMKGYPCQAYSRDGGHTWTTPEYATYTPGGRRIKTPRACPQLWRCGNGRYLLWYHNHSVPGFSERNPAWLTGGIERDGHIHWSQPEIALYDDEPKKRMSYPDLIEQDGRYWISETQKEIARVHEIDAALIEGLWNQDTRHTATTSGVVLTWQPDPQSSDKVRMPKLPDLAMGGGFTIEFSARLQDAAPGQVLLDSRDEQGRGVLVRTSEGGAVRIEMSDGSTIAAWDSDNGTIQADRSCHVVAIVDGGPRIMTFVIDGALCDGGTQRSYGWGRFSPNLGNVTGGVNLRIAPSAHGRIESLRIYNRYLRTSEAVANYRAGQ